MYAITVLPTPNSCSAPDIGYHSHFHGPPQSFTVTVEPPPTRTFLTMPTVIYVPPPAPVSTAAPRPTPAPEPIQWESTGHWYRDLVYESFLNGVLKEEGLDGQSSGATLDAMPTGWAADLNLTLACITDLGVAYLTPYSWVVPPSADTYVIGMWDGEAGDWVQEGLGWYKNPLITDDGSAIYITNRIQLRQIITLLETALVNRNPDLTLNVGIFDSENEDVVELWGVFDTTGLQDALQYLPCF